MHEAPVKTLTGSSRLAVVDEDPAGSVQFEFTPGSKLYITTGQAPRVRERGASFWRPLVTIDSSSEIE